MKMHSFFISFLLLPLCLFSQVPAPGNNSKFYAPHNGDSLLRKIIVEESGIRAVPKNARDSIVVDIKNNSVLYCYPDSTVSFWYKIYAQTSCELTFDIFPANEDNTYNYFLYQSKGEINISDIKRKNIYPVRANLFKDKMALSGTGLSPSSAINYKDTCHATRIRQFYHTAYHGALTVKPGDVLLLNIYHISGTDCGQQFILKANQHTRKFQSLYQTCYRRQLIETEVKSIFNLKDSVPEKPEVKPEAAPAKKKAKATYLVWDSIKHTVIDAEITWTRKDKESYAPEKGSGEIVLEKNSIYTVAFSSLGYKSKKVSFSTKDTLRSFTHYVFLTPVREGEAFSIDKIYFYPNTYAMKPDASVQVDKLLKYLLANQEVKIEIQGYTNGNNRIKASPDDMSEGSFTGTAKRLSELRSETIKKYLMEKGVAGERLIANGYGGSRMIYPDPKNQEEANKNIRVGILVLSQKEAAYPSASKTK